MSTNKLHFILITILTVCLFISVSKAQTITSTTAGGAWGSTATWVGGVVPSAGSNVVIAGNVLYQNGAGSCNNLTVNAGASLYNQTGYAWGEQILTVNGNVTNNGTIRSQNDLFVLKIKGNIINNGTWTFKRTELIGNGTQTLSTTNQSKFENRFLVDAASKPTVAAGSAIIFTSIFDLSTSTLDAKNFNIILRGPSSNITNGKVTNVGLLTGTSTSASYYDSPIISEITYDGNITVKGRFRINTNVVFSGTIINADTLENSTGYAHPEKILKINGAFTNNGLIRNGGGNGFAINLTGNFINNGKLEHNRTILSGTGTQILSTTNNSNMDKNFQVDATAKPTIAAGSHLIFTSPFNLSTSTLDAKNFNLTLRGPSANITNGKVINVGLIRGMSTTASFYDSPLIDNIAYEGNVTLRGRFRINTNVMLSGSVINADTLENSTGYGHPEKILKINGAFTNNGLIRNGGSNGLALNITGNFINNGRLEQNRIILSGSGIQILSTTNNSRFDKNFLVDATAKPTIAAGSNLTFTASFDLSKSKLDMKNYKLTLRGDPANITNGRVINVGLITGMSTTASFYDSPLINDITYEGNITLNGRFRINTNVVLSGSVINADTLENSTGYGHPEKVLKIIGPFTNNGIVRDGGSAGFVLDITGNIVLNKNLNNKRVQFSGDGKRTVDLTGYTGAILSSGTNVMLSGANYLPYLSVSAGTNCEVSGDGIFYLTGAVSGNLVNKGKVIKSKNIKTTGDHSYFKTDVKLAAITGLDTLTVEHYGNQVHSSFANALKSYWKLIPTPRNSSLTIDQLTLNYDENQVGSNNESTLQVFHSSDGAQTWKQISTPISITRDPVNNWVKISNAPISGDFVLSSSANPLTVIPSIVVSIIGRSQIRVGPPNRYTIYYVNNSDVPADDFLLAINTGSRVHILKSEHPRADGTVEIIPADSLFYEKEDTTLVFYVAGLAPREERTFDIIATADNVGLAKSNSSMFIDPASITVATIAVWAAKAAVVYVTVKTIDYVFKKANESLELTPERKKAWEIDVNKIPEELKTQETKKEWAAKKIGTKIIEKGLGIVSGGVDIFRAVGRGIWNLGPNLRRKIFSTIQSDLEVPKEEIIDGTTYKTDVSGVNTKTTKRVASWDPNEKIGPTGFGDKKFITSAGKMSYQILFENKKEATAPAYKIVIIDTLSSIYDPESVVFGKTSHEGDLYNWIITRVGNILKWEIEGIELPPNVTPPQGEGYVTFTVNTKNNLPSGTEIKNKATITFDINKPIVTNQYINKLDFTAPKTTMLPVKLVAKGDELLVQWNSDDGAEGSGIESSTIFMSIDNGPYTFAGSSNNDSLYVKMVSGTHTYKFYGLSKDNVGNVELTMPNVVNATATTSVEPLDDTIPLKYALEQNYPNPFNPNTTIGFSIPVEGIVTLRIYNVLGQEVITLVNEVLKPGNYKTLWYAKNISSGIYFYRLETANFNQTKKLLLLK